MSKLSHIPTSIFSEMSQLANTHGAINLAQGFPNFPVDERLLSITEKAIRDNVHQYTPMAGLPALLEEITALTFEKYQRKIDPSQELLITAGATQGVFTIIQSLVNAGDEVIILDPSYDSYEPSVIMANGNPIRISLNLDFSPNFEEIDRAISSKTKLIVINNPHNPTAKVWTEADFIQFDLLLEKHPHVLILADEVYEYINFIQTHISFNSRKNIIDRVIIVSSFGKSLHVTGWKVGYLIAPEHLMKTIKKVHQFLVFSVSSLAQHVIAKYLQLVDFDDVSKMYETKKNLFARSILGSAFEILPCEGTYFQLLKFDKISQLSDVEFAKKLTIECGVAAIPISVFYKNQIDQKILRFCFAKTDETLIEAGKKLSNL